MATWTLQRILRIIATATLLLGFSGALRAQQATAKRLAFGVASVKLERDCVAANGTGRFVPSMDPGAFRLPCVSVRGMIRMAYSGAGVDLSARNAQVVGGPAWIDSDTYSIDAKPEAAASAADMMGPMLLTLLDDRFRLKTHTEARDTPVYLLTVAEPNAKLHPRKDGDCVPIDPLHESQIGSASPDPKAQRTAPKECGARRTGPNPNGPGMALDLYGINMAEFVSRYVTVYARPRRPVIDSTGLKGRFDLRLEFAPPRPDGPATLNGQAVDVPSGDSTDSETSIFTALRKQLGLKLAPGRAPVDTIIIDRVERPSEN